MSRSMQVAGVTLAMLLVVPGCGDSPAHPQVPVALGEQLAFEGRASSSDSEGMTVDCEVMWLIDIESGPHAGAAFAEYRGSGAGFAQRIAVDASGAGNGFFASLGSPATIIRIHTDGRLEIRLNEPTPEDGRFWRELSRFQGTIESPTSGGGEWTCAPLDIDQGGRVDVRGSAIGQWELVEPPTA